MHAGLWRAIVTNHSLEFPEGFGECAWEVQAKGWFGEARLCFQGKRYRMNFYDPVRLGQEIDSAIQRSGLFFEPNLLVVQSLTRSNMEAAVARLVEADVGGILVAE
jgi:hypothetical protein